MQTSRKLQRGVEAVSGMSVQCLELTVERTIDGDAFDYIHKVCTLALAQLGLQCALLSSAPLILESMLSIPTCA